MSEKGKQKEIALARVCAVGAGIGVVQFGKRKKGELEKGRKTRGAKTGDAMGETGSPVMKRRG
jgi:hypothetical protein